MKKVAEGGVWSVWKLGWVILFFLITMGVFGLVFVHLD